MSTLKFADVYNLVVFLSKPTESEGFKQIVDFLNANPIKYALTLQALVDGKKVIITESTIRRDLQLDDAEGVYCLPNASIIEQLTLMGKRLFRKGNTLISNHDGSSSRGNRKIKRKDTELPHTSVPTSVTDEAVNEEMDGRLEKAATTTTSLDAGQDRGNIFKNQSKATPNEPVSQGTSSGGGLKCQETMRDAAAQTRLSARVESSKDEGLGEEDVSKQGRIADIDANKDIYLVNVHTDIDIFSVNDKEVKDKGKAKMIKEHVKLKKKDQIQFDEKVALKLQEELQAEYEKQQRLACERAQQEEANITLIKSWDVVQAKIDADYQLAEILQDEEQQELNDKEKATFLCYY
nr:hypothetical protein [Tanacetum cinerariifolium]